MNGAQLIVKAAVASGIEYCFANPGTTEIPLVAAMASAPALKPVLSLFEGVCTGAADGYGRIAGKPAMTLTHLGPGFANGIANLHNARRANTPIVNVIGDHASWHVNYDPPLASDIQALAGECFRMGAHIAHRIGCRRRFPRGSACRLASQRADRQPDSADGPASQHGAARESLHDIAGPGSPFCR